MHTSRLVQRLGLMHASHLRNRLSCPLANAVKTADVISRQYTEERRKESFPQYLTRNFQLWKKEVTSKLKNENVDHMFDQSRVLWKFEGEKSFEDFYVLTDADIGGNSWAKIDVSRNNKLLFYGHVSTVVPNDGETERSGFCAIRSRPFERSFNRVHMMDLSQFNTLVIKVKGDGRPFFVNLYTQTSLSVHKDDVWMYILFTRGGPYWQTVNIPFSKFVLTHAGRVQDRQSPMDSDKFIGLGLMIADSVDGEFSLEIDSIRAIYDPTQTEEISYEQYTNPIW